MIFQPTEISVRNQQTIQLTFSSQPSLFLTKSNFSIISTFNSVSDLEILSIDINSFIITLHTRPMFNDNLYLIQLLDINTQIFEDINNIELSNIADARSIYFVGVEDINPIRDAMLQNLPPNYNTGEQTLVYDITTTIANEINNAGITLEEIKNDNFISISIVDELYFRGVGPTDRIKNEGTYNVIRVSNTITGTTTIGSKTFDPIIDPNIPFEIINLRVMQVIEVVPNGTSSNQFDGFLITVQHQNITKLLSVTKSPGTSIYDPTKFGYALLNNNYDRFARSSPILQSNQILLNPLNNIFSEPIPGDILTVTYEFDNVGRRVDKQSVILYSIFKQIAEDVPAGVTNFFLEFSNIILSSGQLVSIGGVVFTISTNNLNRHVAFLHELVFNTDSLPSTPGEYAINYITGQVFVFGTQNEIGTGTTPPVATYFYKNIATSGVDYFISDDGYDIRLNQFSQFAVQQFIISFAYEDVFSSGIDYIVSSHIEVLQERIDNRLISDFTIETKNSPVKDVHQILNETTGETYTLGLINGNQVSFAGNIPPATSTTLGELAQFGIVDDEILNVLIPTNTPNNQLKVFPIALKNHPILNQRYDGIGSNFNTSIQFTRADLFVNEFYFNPFEDIIINLGKLKTVGDYIIDYASGNIYLGVTSMQNFDIGHISYAYGVFIPQHKHVTSVSNIGLGTTSTHIIQEYDLGTVEDGLIIPKNLNYAYDTFDGKAAVPNSNSIFIAQLQDDFTLYVKYPIKKVYSVFTQNSVDAYGIAVLSTKNLFNSSVNSFNNTLIDLKTYVVLPTVLDINPNYYHVIIDDVASDVKSIIVLDTGTQLIDTDLRVIKYKNIIITSVSAAFGVATITMQNIITLNDNDIGLGLDYLIDIAGHQFIIMSIIGVSSPPTTTGNTITVAYSIFGPQPIANVGSQILDQNGIIVANHLNIISITELPDMLYVLHYDILPSGILINYQVKDSNGNIFVITDVQPTSVIVIALTTIPIIDPVAKIETQSILQQSTPSIGQTTLLLPLDAPITTGTNLKIGYIPKLLNDEIIAANFNTFSAGGAGMVVDYSVGQFFLDYTHLDDELLISYDWGDNQLDWSISDTLNINDPYYISYQYGASRDGLETNFGPLTNVNFLQNAPLSITRETYRTAVSAAIKAFLKGPTHEAIRLLAHAFTQINPDIEEAILNQWIVGRDPLRLQDPIITENTVFGNGKYGEGLIITNGNSIQLPGDSSLRLTQGTFSTWFRPNWSGNQADEYITFNLPTMVQSVYYNAHKVLPQDTKETPWYLVINSDAYGTAFVANNYLEIHNAKNEYTTSNIPSSDGYRYDGYDGYMFYSTLGAHDGFTLFPYANRIGKYMWSRDEQILSIANDIDVNFIGYVSQLNYVNPSINIVQTANIIVNDGYNEYSTGLYLQKRKLYTAQIILEDVHLKTIEPFPQLNTPIYVNTLFNSSIVTIVSGDINTLSLGQQLIIDTAYPTLTNILGFTATTIIMRFPAQTTLSNVVIDNLDPPSKLGTQDGYGEIQLQDKLGTRLVGTIAERVNGWERQLLVKLLITSAAPEFTMIIGSNDTPLTTQTPVIDFVDAIIPGTDIFVDGYGNVFEIDSVQLPYVWLKKPSASGAETPLGIITAFRKLAGVQFPDNTLMSIPVNWSNATETSMVKQNGIITFTVNQITVTGSYISHSASNAIEPSKIIFGSIDLNVDSIIRIQSINYNIHPVFSITDIYMGNTGNNPLDDIVQFKYDISTSGIPAINQDKYFAIFTNKGSASIDEPTDEIFVKMKIPSTWTLSDGITSTIYSVMPTIKFIATTMGDFIDIIDGYGLTYRKIEKDILQLTAIDGYAYIPGNASILMDGGPELRISAGKKHFLFEAETPEGALRLYRTGTGEMTAEAQLSDLAVLNIRSDISPWIAGQLHHIAMSWKISAPDEIDELHLFIDGDEVPNEIMFGSEMPNGNIGQIYEELLTVIPKASVPDGYIINDFRGSGLLIPTAASIQPNNTWINKTIVLDAIPPGPNIYLEEPLVVGAFTSVPGGVLLFLSKDGEQINFAFYGPSTPVSYGLATYATALITTLVRTNFGIYNDGYELDGPYTSSPEFRQIGNTQIIELYSIDSDTGHYTEIPNVLINPITIRTYGLLTQRINDRIFQYGSLIRNIPIDVQVFASNQILNTNVVLGAGSPAFETDLSAPVDPTQVTVTKVLLPRILI